MEEGILKSEEKYLTQGQEDRNAAKEGDRLIYHFAVLLDAMLSMSYNACITHFEW